MAEEKADEKIDTDEAAKPEKIEGEPMVSNDSDKINVEDKTAVAEENKLESEEKADVVNKKRKMKRLTLKRKRRQRKKWMKCLLTKVAYIYFIYF